MLNKNIIFSQKIALLNLFLKKLEKKNLDIIVANNASTMGTDSNTVEIIKKDKSSVEINQKNKIELAYDIFSEVISVLKKGKNE